MSFEDRRGAAGRPGGLHVWKSGAGARIALVHGFTQSSSSWAPVVEDLESSFELIAIDLPGHGHSPMPAQGSDIFDTAKALGRAGGKAAYVGYSLGGRCCLHLALENPNLVESLIIVGAHPGIKDDSERKARREADERLALELELAGDAGVPRFIDTWLNGPLFAHMTSDQADRGSRLGNCAAGLAASLRTVGTGTQVPLWERLGNLNMPVLVVVGAKDSKFRPIAEQTAGAIGQNARLAVVARAGHAVCLECPDVFTELVREFLRAGA